MGQVRAACPGLLALSLSSLRPTLGAGRVAAFHKIMGPAGLRLVVTPRHNHADPDPHPDPFAERTRVRAAVSRQLLGGRFHFESSSAELLSLVHWAYADLPEHAFTRQAPQFTVRLVLNGKASHQSRTGPA